MNSKSENKTPIGMRIELNTDHFESVTYMIKNIIRMEHTTPEYHARMIRLAEEIVELGKKTFAGKNVIPHLEPWGWKK